MPITVSIRMPIAKNEKIGVETDSYVTPSEKDVEDDKGVYAWDFDVDAGESTILALGYTVSYTEGKELSGI